MIYKDIKEEQTMKNITKIVLTGGPCSGKSTFMNLAKQHFEDLGYTIFIDNEAATDLISGGISPATMGMYQFQKYCIALQLKKEELFKMAAEKINKEKIIIFYDRGILDDKGYVSDQEFKEILTGFDIKEEDLPSRYDLVLHLTTAAKGLENVYSDETNQARYEDCDEAINVDNMILESWKVHPNRQCIDSALDFDLKMKQAIQYVQEYLNQQEG